MEKDYVQAQNASYSNQGKIFTIPANKLGEIVITPLGFQPLGIASLGNRIAITAYFEPAICLAEITRDNTEVHFTLEWIRGVKHREKSVRLFPNFLKRGEANRAQTVNFEAENNLWISRNGDNKLFNIVKDGAEWKLTGKTIKIPTDDMVQSAHLREDTISTIECSLDIKSWYLCVYTRHEQTKAKAIFRQNVDPFIFGATYHHGSRCYITDFRSGEPHGIYRDSNLIIPEIYGNDLCFLPNGSILATRYGQASNGPFSGEPGALIYIPAAYVPK
ncbi:MAG: hypothetical protein ABIB72_02260 [Candidatus Falkowbacteria bacterium]